MEAAEQAADGALSDLVGMYGIERAALLTGTPVATLRRVNRAKGALRPDYPRGPKSLV